MKIANFILHYLDLNYALRSADASGNAKAQKVLDNMGNLLSIQATYKF